MEKKWKLEYGIVASTFKQWLEEPTKDLQIANMYRRLQKVVTHTILAFSKKKKSSFIISFNIFFISWHSANEMHKLFYSKSLDCMSMTCIQCIVCMLDCRGANKEKKILIRTAAVRIATSILVAIAQSLLHLTSDDLWPRWRSSSS